jgi:hypothetical protein
MPQEWDWRINSGSLAMFAAMGGGTLAWAITAPG